MNDHFYPNANKFRRVESQPENHFRNAKIPFQNNEEQKIFGDDCGNRYSWHDKVNKMHKDIMEEKANCDKM